MAKLNPTCPETSDMFCGLVESASAVFTYHLVLGGAYADTEHCKEIGDHLLAIMELIKDYDKKILEVYDDKIEVIK